MIFKIDSIRGRIFAGFFLIITLSFLLFILHYSYLKRIDSIRKTERELSNIEIQTLRIIKIDNDFLDIEAINTEYFKTKESIYLNKRESLMTELYVALASQQENNHVHHSIQKHLGIISKTLSTYNKSFYQLADNLYVRGFKDYGLEGEMRKYAHQLETVPSLDLSLVLSLRRHEKDFFLRNDESYVDEFNNLATTSIKRLEKNVSDTTALRILRSYVDIFNELVKVQKVIGLSSNEGLRDELNNLTSDMSDDFYALSLIIADQSSSIINRIFIFFVVSIIVSLFIAIFLSYYLSTKISSPVKKLSGIMDKYLNTTTDPRKDYKMSINKPAKEIEKLSESFFTLMRQRTIQLKEIEMKSKQMALKNDELGKLNEELDKFIYSTAHDLRSPLSSILGLIHLLEYDSSEDSRKEYSQMMRSSISKMERFIRDVVDYSKNKKLGVEHVAVNIKHLIQDVFEEHRFIPAYKNIFVDLPIAEDTIVYTDYNRLKIIFNNLISNAIRYSDAEKSNQFIRIEISVKSDCFKIIFEDNGQGISEVHLNKIFNMFFRANERSDGSGLGLFILQETIKTLGGRVLVSSKLHVGTVFEIDIPNKEFEAITSI